MAASSCEAITLRDMNRTDRLYALVEELRARAPRPLRALRQQPFGQVFGIKDPAGQTQFIVEFARDRPSKAVG